MSSQLLMVNSVAQTLTEACLGIRNDNKWSREHGENLVYHMIKSRETKEPLWNAHAKYRGPNSFIH